MRSSPGETIKTIDLQRTNLHISRFKEGPVFSHMKLLCIGDKALHSYMIGVQRYIFKNSKSTKTHLTPGFWKTIIKVAKDIITEKIVADINKNGGGYGLEIDTTSDISKKNQLSVVSKYVSASEENGFIVNERTIFLKHVKNTTGEGLFGTVKTSLESIGLSLQNVTGKNYSSLAFGYKCYT